MDSRGAGIPQNVTPVVGDAITKLSNDGHLYDLVVSNPPYVPTGPETQSSKKVSVKDTSFWAGTGMICHMLEDTLPKLQEGGHVVVLIPSTSLKSKRLYEIFQKNIDGFQARILYQKEVAYKAGFAGNGRVQHLLSTEQEATTPTHFVGSNLDLYVGITKPGNPRDYKVEDGRRTHRGYHWQMIYIIDFVARKSLG